MRKLRALINRITDFGGGISERRLFVYAASGGYCLFMSLVPFAIVLFSLLPYTGIESDVIIRWIGSYLSSSMGEVVENIVGTIFATGSATLTLGIVLTVFSASAAMKAVMRGVNAAYDIEIKQNYFVFTARAMAYMVVLVITLVLSVVVLVYGGKILEKLAVYIPFIGRIDGLLTVLRYLFLFLLLTMFFLLLFKWIPGRRMSYGAQLPGAVFTAAAWLIFSAGYAFYVKISGQYGAYGFIGTIMVAMLWMYWCLFFLLLGAYINSRILERKRSN